MLLTSRPVSDVSVTTGRCAFSFSPWSWNRSRVQTPHSVSVCSWMIQPPCGGSFTGDQRWVCGYHHKKKQQFSHWKSCSLQDWGRNVRSGAPRTCPSIQLIYSGNLHRQSSQGTSHSKAKTLQYYIRERNLTHPIMPLSKHPQNCAPWIFQAVKAEIYCKVLRDSIRHKLWHNGMQMISTALCAHSQHGDYSLFLWPKQQNHSLSRSTLWLHFVPTLTQVDSGNDYRTGLRWSVTSVAGALGAAYHCTTNLLWMECRQNMNFAIFLAQTLNYLIAPHMCKKLLAILYCARYLILR